MAILLSLLLFVAGCADGPRYIQEHNPDLSSAPKQPRGVSSAYEAYVNKLIAEGQPPSAAPVPSRLTDEEQAKIRLAEQYLRFQQQQSAQQDDLAEAMALQGMMNSVNVWTQQMHQQAPSMPSYQMPLQAPIVIPRATNCTTTRNGTQLYTTCY